MVQYILTVENKPPSLQKLVSMMSPKPSRSDLEKQIASLRLENARLKEQLNASPDEGEVPENLKSESSQRKSASPTLQLVVDNIPQAIFWKDVNLNYLGCNIVFAKAAGFKRTDEITGLSDYDLPWKKAEAEFFRECDARVMATDQGEFNIIETLRNSFGEKTWLNTNKIPLHDNWGIVIGVLGTFEDITGRIQAEETLKHYETITATIDDLVSIIDTHSIYKAVNESHFHAYGVKREQILGKSIVDLVGEELYHNLVKGKIDQVLDGKTVTYECWREFPCWGKRYVHATYFPIFSEDGKEVTGAVSKVRDMTQQKKLETQLQQSQKMEAIGRLAGGIAHDFNNILSVINGYSDLCVMKIEKEHPCLPYIEMIKESGLRAARLTQQLLAFSRRQIIKPEIMNLADELSGINQMLTRLLGENIHIEFHKKHAVWDVRLDRSQFEQIVMNLAVNSRDAMPYGGNMTIELTNITCEENSSEILTSNNYVLESGDYVMLAISDSGVGMSPETLQLIYEPFFTTKDKNKGTGLGLSTVYGIVKQNHGYISVYSEIGEGTTFKLYFPRCKEHKNEDASDADAGEGKVVTGVETILLVEDDNALRKLCVEILTALGYTVLEASDGKEAIETSNRFHGQIDLLLTDVVMPLLNGPEMAKILTVQYPAMGVVYMSGYTENAIVHQGVLDDGIFFVHKPISHNVLAATVRSVLDQQKEQNTQHRFPAKKRQSGK
jgi:PAS domain S-box-containing protein